MLSSYDVRDKHVDRGYEAVAIGAIVNLVRKQLVACESSEVWQCAVSFCIPAHIDISQVAGRKKCDYAINGVPKWYAE